MLAKLKILAYKDEHLRSKIGEYEVQINPERYSQVFGVTFSEDKGIDTASIIPKFKTQTPQQMKLEFYLDSTGVISGVSSVPDKIKKFKETAYDFNGQIHSPNYLKLLWGDLVFKCLLDSLDVDYTLFSPGGTPLRAKLTANFRQHQSPDELERRSAKKSSDLTHSRTVVGGDSLPLMCHQIYGDSKYYLQVARANDLTSFRRLVVGTKIEFPPVEK
jgi:hypothetical protein